MLIQRVIFLFGRFLYYGLLVTLLSLLVYTLAHGQGQAALIFLVLSVLAIYRGLVRMKIPARSVVVRDGKVVFFIPEKTIRNRFDFVSRGQSIVELPHYGLLDRTYTLEISYPGADGGICACRLSLQLGYLMEPEGWQRAYEGFVRYQDRLSMEVRRLLVESAGQLPVGQFPAEGEDSLRSWLEPVVAELNRGLENVGLKIETTNCSRSSGSSLVRYVSSEQEMVEKIVEERRRAQAAFR